MLLQDEMIVDNFAGGGGASTGIEQGLDRIVDVAINHDPEAVAMHRANHPNTRHLCQSVWRADPREVCGGRPVGLAWFSPDCKHFSKAKGGKPVEKHIRDLAWVVVHWAKLVRPRVIKLENVEEFRDWGPLTTDEEGRMVPDPDRRGFTFKAWVRELKRLGYAVDWREMRACDYGAPTIRKRLFVIARCDGKPIEWPAPTHGPGLMPYRTAAECIDWSIPCPSIFERKRPLADATLRRIARGIMRYVVEAKEPFIVGVGGRMGQSPERPFSAPFQTITSKGDSAIVVPTLIQTGYGERTGQAPRVPGLEKPLGTLVGTTKHALVAAFLAKHYTGVDGSELAAPIGTVTAIDHHSLVASSLIKLKGTCRDGQPVTAPMPTVQAGGLHIGEVRAFLIKYYGTDQDPRLSQPLHTITSKDRFGLVTVEIAGEPYVIADIGMRMLARHELFAAQGFRKDYIIDRGLFDLPDGSLEWRPLTNTASVRMCGNSVSPVQSEALVRTTFAAGNREAA